MLALDKTLDFVLPPELEACEPPEARGLARDQVRLMVTFKGSDEIFHSRFCDLPEYLEPGDLVVANDSATLPAAIAARPRDGDPFLLHLSTNLHDDLWVVEPRAANVVAGQLLNLRGGGRAMLLAPYGASKRLWIAGLDLPIASADYLARWGTAIKYPYVRGDWPIEMYQTVYATNPGSAEMPSAGRAFTQQTLKQLADRGVGFTTLTLHTGVSSPENNEPPYRERFVVPRACTDAVKAARKSGGRIIAVGTTVVRALETASSNRAEVEPRSGWTDLVITPERGVRMVDGLLTGFHEPRSSHLAMLEAIAGSRHLERAYEAALEHRYLWHEFGDLHLILP